MSTEARLHLNEAEVTATVIDGEAIMINLGSGVYYSTDGAGARIWELAASGATLTEIADNIAKEYSISVEQATEDAKQIIDEFVAERLLVPYASENAPTLPTASSTPASYTKPSLEIYRDMGHLLALDPPMPGLENISWNESPSA